MLDPAKRTQPLTQKQVHVGLEALIYKADHLAACKGLTLERATCLLQYRDKEGNTQTVSADVKMEPNKKEIKNEKRK